MAGHIRGITVTLYDRTETGRDALNAPIFEDTDAQVDNVLVAPMSSTEILETLELTGARAVYQLGIPKGDAHDWSAGKKVSFFGEDWRIIALPTEGIDDLIPLQWNKKVQVERYE
jgi:hypothetical protein